MARVLCGTQRRWIKDGNPVVEEKGSRSQELRWETGGRRFLRLSLSVVSLCAGHHHVGITTAAAGTHQPLAPIEHGRFGTVASTHLGWVRFDLMLGTTCTRR